MMSILQRTLTLGLYSIVTGCTFLICETLERSGEQKYETLGVVLTCLRQLCHLATNLHNLGSWTATTRCCGLPLQPQVGK